MVRGVNPVELAIDRSYLISMIKEAEKEFKRSENLFMKIKHDIKINEERLSLFKNFFNTFILEARKKYNL